MNPVVTPSNVFYLTQPAPREEPTPRRATRRRALWHSLRSAWWRLRLTVIELRLAVRRPAAGLVVDGYPAFLDSAADVVESRPRPRRSQPARVIDFGVARLRLRPHA